MNTTRSEHASIVDLDDLRAGDARVVGSKAAALSLLRAAGENVPPGIVALPHADARAAATTAIAQFGDVELAVRSSSLAEDLSQASFAGQYLTVLGVRTVDSIADAVERVRASSNDARDRGYADNHASPMPVLIMPMVAAEAAGVGFGANPVTGDDEVIVEAVKGLGEALVAGTVTPQRFVCHAEPSEDERPGDRAITTSQAADIAEIVRRLSERRGWPQDVEWAIAGGEIYVLQSRPITALPVAPAMDLPGPRESWLRADENYAHPVRPLEFSVWAPRLEASFTQVFAEVGAPIETMRYRSIGGWMYARFVPPLDRGRDDEKAPPAFLFGMLLRVIPPLRSRMRTAARTWRSEAASHAVDHWEGGERDELRAKTRQLRLVDRAALSDADLGRHLDDALNHLQAASDVHFRLPVLGTFLTTGHLGVLANRLLGWSPSQTLRLLQGFSTVTDAADDIGNVVSTLRSDPEALRLIAADPASLLEHPGLGGAAIRDHVDHYGHRIVGMDLAHPTWAEDPAPLLAILRSRLGAQVVTREASTEAVEAEAEAAHRLADRPTELAAFEAALTAARRGISLGDETEADVLEVFGLIRYVAMEAGRRLTDRGAIQRPTDVLYLSEDELRSALQGEAITVDIGRRQGEYLWAKSHRGPKRYGPEPPPMPSLRWAPRGARPFLEAMMWAIDNLAASAPSESPTEGVLAGTPASPGRVTATARIVRDPSEFGRIEPGDVLVCPCTIAAWSVVFPLVSAVVTEVGGPLSHPGILAREFGIPAVLGVDDALRLIEDGQTVTVDGTSGTVAPHA